MPVTGPDAAGIPKASGVHSQRVSCRGPTIHSSLEVNVPPLLLSF